MSSWTEADLLRMLRTRYGAPGRNGRPPRYIVAAHVGMSASMVSVRNRRIADMIVLDRNSTFPQTMLDEPDQWGRTTVSNYGDAYHAVHGFEVKTSRADWLRELRDPSKASAFKDFCTHWWLVAPADVVKPGELPDGWGFMAPAGDMLRVRVDAPRLDAEPMPAAVVIALIRSLQRGGNLG